MSRPGRVEFEICAFDGRGRSTEKQVMGIMGSLGSGETEYKHSHSADTDGTNNVY